MGKKWEKKYEKKGENCSAFHCEYEFA